MAFQVELLECAIKQNTIVCVNTEGGKRFLSTMLIRELVVKEDGQKNNLAVLLLNNGINLSLFFFNIFVCAFKPYNYTFKCINPEI